MNLLVKLRINCEMKFLKIEVILFQKQGEIKINDFSNQSL